MQQTKTSTIIFHFTFYAFSYKKNNNWSGSSANAKHITVLRRKSNNQGSTRIKYNSISLGYYFVSYCNVCVSEGRNFMTMYGQPHDFTVECNIVYKYKTMSWYISKQCVSYGPLPYHNTSLHYSSETIFSLNRRS